MHTCPVCYYDKMEDPPERFNICPCCGTEFENDDYWLTREELRQAWVDGGMKWWYIDEAPPSDWSPEDQLRKARKIDPGQ